MTLKSFNPYNGSPVASYDQVTKKELNGLLDIASEQWIEWRGMPFNKRKSLLQKVSELLCERKEQYAKLITLEMGKAISESRAEVEKCARVCDYYAENAERFLASEEIETEYQRAHVVYQPLGVILAIMPWNFPFWQVFRFAAPTIMAGNVAILKHASNVSGCSLAIQQVFTDAGFPDGVFTSLLLRGKETANLIGDERIAAVTLTGSTQAGKAVAEAAGRAIKKSVLELGGSDPYIILDDADIDLAVEKCVAGRLLNAGQSCIGAKRFIVTDAVADAFIPKFVEAMKATKMGDPLADETQMGPLATKQFREELHYQVQKSVELGAELLTGGVMFAGEGAFYPPTVLTNVKKGMPAYSEELFGPVASVITVKDEDEAIFVANDTNFGLGAALFTKDIKRGHRLAADAIRAGSVFVNEFVKSDPRLPFGGIKESGFGRELAVYGIREFTNIKTIVVS
ncbi:MAG: NAD-dependent succinate-semialdehyde dehydrogenase [Salinivirgaceae bacterium]|jgi:succinate-semialdehyde dehydrogenase/glutarate-semialdehyde dehydrogenase|nr:NAD-dependent succinate-semialdehyde dehydrogenase [Salinivirgaceae bacterium]